MLFSILIPVYNVERYLGECLESVLDQDYKDYEIILVDDGSTDSSGKICDAFKAEHEDICTVKHKENEGLLAARRDAFLLAQGEYCICLDSDDCLADGALSYLADMICKYHADFILYDLYTFTSDGKAKNINDGLNVLKENYVYPDTQILKEKLLDLSYNNWSMAAKCIKTSIAKTNFDFRQFYDVSYGEDAIQSIILYNEASNFVYTSRQIYKYRLESGMTKTVSIKYVEDFYKVTQLMKNVCGDWSDDVCKRIDMFFSLKIYEFAVNIGNFRLSFSNFKMMLEQLMNNEENVGILSSSVKKIRIKRDFKKKIVLEILLRHWYFLLYALVQINCFLYRLFGG